MDLDIVSFPGEREKPSIIFIHGLGMDKNIWTAPSKSRILGGMFPLKVIIGRSVSGEPRFLETLFHDLRDRQYPVITWSQQRMSGQIDSVVPELAAVVGLAQVMSDAGIILIGHSRGGLIGRRYLSKKENSVRGLITIATPHKGSTIAKVAGYVKPLAYLISPLIADSDRNNVARSLKRISEFLKSRALQELLPESQFFQTLRDGPREGISYVSAGGTNPVLFTFSHFSFPTVFEKIIPGNLYPEEIQKGRGDGLVSDESAKIPWADEHFSFDRNHVEILFDKETRDTIMSALVLM
jgi:pimeloyl-ACP methyl ester carboxylesterase